MLNFSKAAKKAARTFPIVLAIIVVGSVGLALMFLPPWLFRIAFGRLESQPFISLVIVGTIFGLGLALSGSWFVFVYTLMKN